MNYVNEEEDNEEKQSSNRSLIGCTDVRLNEPKDSEFGYLRSSLIKLSQSLLTIQKLKETIERDTELIHLAALHVATGIERNPVCRFLSHELHDTNNNSPVNDDEVQNPVTSSAQAHVATGIERNPVCRFLDCFDRSSESHDTNNNSPVNDDVLKNPVTASAQAPLLRTSSAPLLERVKVSRPSKFRLPRKKKDGGKKSPRKKKQDYVLVPLITGIFGDVMQKKPNGKPKYTDVATIIDQGTSEHKNVDTASANRYESPTTIEESHSNRLYYVKPLAEEIITLQDLMNPKKGRQLFTESQAKFVCASLLLAAEFLHENDIVHGSILPKKIVFNEKYYPQIACFGTAEILTERIGRFRERLPLQYTPPEQLYEDIYENTDIFSIAVVVYEMIFGRAPHHGKTDFETRRNLCNYYFTAEFDNSKLSESGQKFLKLCLRKSKRKRFNLLDLKRGLFTSVPWFEDFDEDKMFEQTFPSPLKSKIQTLKKDQKKESTHGTTTEKPKEETS